MDPAKDHENLGKSGKETLAMIRQESMEESMSK
jgi:hypothetical protein